MSEKTKNWAAFGGEWLKAIDVLNNTDEYVIVGVDSKFEEGKGEVLHLTVEREGTQKKFGCNKTNTYAIQVSYPEKPEDVIGKVITFNKVKVNKPGTNPPQEVDGLRLQFKSNTEEPKEVDTDSAGLDEDNNL